MPDNDPPGIDTHPLDDTAGPLNALGKGHVAIMAIRAQLLVGTVTFVGPLVIDLAERTADADGKVTYAGVSVKPGTVFTLTSFVASLVGVLLAPLIGSVVDHTSHRRTLLMWFMGLAAVSGGVVLPLLADETWSWAAAMVVVLLIALELCLVPMLAYLPETSANHKLVHKTGAMGQAGAMFSALINIVMVLLAFQVMGSSDEDDDEHDDEHTGDDDEMTYDEMRFLAQAALAISVALMAVAGVPATLHYFPARAPAEPLPEGESYLRAGLQKMGRWRAMLRDEFPQVRLALMVSCLAFAGILSLVIVSAVFLKDELEFSNQDIGLTVLAIMATSVPSTWAWLAVERRRGPKQTLSIMLVVWGLNLCVGSLLASPDRPALTFIHIVGYGSVFAATPALLRTIFACVCPARREAEMMGIYTVCTRLLTWAPPLLFSIMNEQAGGTRAALATMGLFFFAALAVLQRIDLEAAAKDIAATLEGRRFGSAENKGGAADGGDHARAAVLPAAEAPPAEA